MAWAMVVGAGVSLVGNMAGKGADATNSASQRQDDRDAMVWNTQTQRQDNMWQARLQESQYGASATNRERDRDSQIATSMYDRNYQVEDRQARYDSFKAQFGDVEDNVNNYFRTLSSASVKAQNNDDINARIEGVSTRLTQTMSERGIQGNSGIAIQALAQADMQGEMSKVEANRNVDNEIAGAQSEFLTAKASDPFLARAPDFDAGKLSEGDINDFGSSTDLATGYDIPDQKELPSIGDITKPVKPSLF